MSDVPTNDDWFRVPIELADVDLDDDVSEAMACVWLLGQWHLGRPVSVRAFADRVGWGWDRARCFMEKQHAWGVANGATVPAEPYARAPLGRPAEDVIEVEPGALFELAASPHTHTDLVAIAVRWLRGSRKCAVAFAEMATYARVNPDAIGFTGSGGGRPTSILVECKVSRSDFRADRHKPIHTAPDSCPGQQRWYLTPPGLVRADELPEGWGLAEAGASRVCIVREAAPPAGSAQRAAEDTRFLLSALRRHELGSIWDAAAGRFEGVDERKARQRGGA